MIELKLSNRECEDCRRAAEKICDAEASPGGGAWNPDGAILFSQRTL
jgi:hypothetical protein